MKKYALVLGIFLLSFLSCNTSPKPIGYGSDSCHFCSMTIVDKQHAAQFMTKKGKSYAFDATECMLNHLKEIDASTVGLYLVNDYDAPGELINATKATYLISKSIPSPMGEFLTAFADRDTAQNILVENQGTLYSWQELLEKFKKR